MGKVLNKSSGSVNAGGLLGSGCCFSVCRNPVANKLTLQSITHILIWLFSSRCANVFCTCGLVRIWSTSRTKCFSMLRLGNQSTMLNSTWLSRVRYKIVLRMCGLVLTHVCSRIKCVSTPRLLILRSMTCNTALLMGSRCKHGSCMCGLVTMCLPFRTEFRAMVPTWLSSGSICCVSSVQKSR